MPQPTQPLTGLSPETVKLHFMDVGNLTVFSAVDQIRNCFGVPSPPGSRRYFEGLLSGSWDAELSQKQSFGLQILVATTIDELADSRGGT